MIYAYERPPTFWPRIQHAYRQFTEWLTEISYVDPDRTIGR